MLLITGATGNVGRALVEELIGRDTKVRAVTRNPNKANLPEDAEVVAGDVTSPQTLADALTGVTTVFLNPATVGDSAAAFLAFAREHGVTRVVMLSSAAVRDELPQQTDPLAAWHKRIEDEVTSSGLDWTILRSFEFATNVVQQWADQIRYTGGVSEAYGKATTAPIHERDIAAVAAEVLISVEHVGHIYSLSGPESLTRIQMVKILADTIGRPIRFEEVSKEQALQDMTTHGLPSFIAESVLAMRAASVGHDAIVTPAVQELTGHPARTFGSWAADHATDFA